MRFISSLLFSIVLSAGLPQQSVYANNSASAISTTSARIILDGEFDDWDTLSPAYVDPSGDAPEGSVDFGQIWITNDEQYLFLRFELGVEVILQDFNEICLYLDTDDDASTGLSIQGIGAELSWTFGSREGMFYIGDAGQPISQGVLGVVSAPTVSGTAFEVALDRTAIPDGQRLLFNNETVRLVMWDIQSDDRLPDASGGIEYTFDDNTVLPELENRSLKKQNPDDVRFLSYNVEFDALFDPEKQPAFLRMIRAMAPDILGFQEILSHTAEETRAVVEAALPLPVGQSWYTSRSGPDLVVVSRFPILQTFSIFGWASGDTNAAFLLDMREKWGTELLLLVAHPPCCRNESGRQFDIDAMMAFVRDAQSEGGALDLAPETPIVILGDMNLVGWKEQLNTLLTGDIVNTDQFGSSFSPDWDGSPFADLMPRHVSLPMTFTWYREASSFHPGRLDFIVYSDAVLEAQNNYVLFTPSMPQDSLDVYQLQPGDATLASDHLPVIGDFQYRTSTGTSNEPKAREYLLSMHSYPNPFLDRFTVSLNVPYSGDVTLTLYNALGQEVSTLLHRSLSDGPHQIQWNASALDLTSGLYFLQVRTGDQLYTEPILRVNR